MNTERLVFCLKKAYEEFKDMPIIEDRYAKVYKAGVVDTLEFLMAAYEDREENYEKSKGQEK